LNVLFNDYNNVGSKRHIILSYQLYIIVCYKMRMERHLEKLDYFIQTSTSIELAVGSSTNAID